MRKLLIILIACIVSLSASPIVPGSNFPKMRRVKTTVFVSCGGTTESAEAQIACRILQGIVNRDSAEIFISTGDKEMDWWKYIDVKWKRPAKGVITTGENRGLRTLFRSYKDRIDKLVVCNYANNDYTFNMGLLMACVDNVLPVSEQIKDELVSEFGWDKEIVDIRDKWPDITRAYNWALEEIMPRINKTLVVSAGLRDDWRGGGWRIFDYAVATRSFTFWVDDKTTTGKNIIKKILRTPGYPKNAVCMGYGMHGDDLNDTTNPEGFGYVVGDLFPNASYYSSFPTETFENWQPEGKSIEAQPGKIYVSLYWSDGDNISFNHNLEHILWNQKERGSVPVSMTLSPALCEIAPFIIRYYHETVTENDELIGGPSGAQYIQEPFYKPSDYESWCEMNGEYLKLGGLRSTNSSLRFPIQPFYNNGFVKSNVTGTIAWSSGAYYDAYDWCGMPVVCGGGVCGDTKGIYNYLKNIAVNDLRPVFTGVYMVQAGLGSEGYAGISKVVDRLQSEYPGRFVFMRASDLLATAGKYFSDRKKPFKEMSLPGRVEAEDFDLGGQGAGFYNSARSNEGGAYRNEPGECIGIGAGASGYHVGWTNSNEWLNYTVNVDKSATYRMTVRYATRRNEDKSISVMLDDNTIAVMQLPSTDGSDAYSESSVLLPLSEGTANLRVLINDSGLDLDYYDFEIVDDLIPAIEPGRYYKITALHSGKSLGLKSDNATNGTSIVQRDFDGDDTQLWSIEVAGDYCYGLRNKASGLNILLRGENTIGQFEFDCTGDLGKWNLIYDGDGLYTICLNKTRRSLEIAGASLDDGALLTIGSSDEGSNRRFRIEPVGGQSGITDMAVVPSVFGQPHFSESGTEIHIPVNGDEVNDVRFRIYSLTGLLISDNRCIVSEGNAVIPAKGLSAGVYLWKLETGTTGSSGKIFKH